MGAAAEFGKFSAFAVEGPLNLDGFREFIETRLLEFVKESPEVAVYLKPRRHKMPIIKAEYCK